MTRANGTDRETRRDIFFSILIGLFLIGVLTLASPFPAIRFRLEVQPENSGDFKAFFHLGRGFRPESSAQLRLVHDGQFQRPEFSLLQPIGGGGLQAIRLRSEAPFNTLAVRSVEVRFWFHKLHWEGRKLAVLLRPGPGASITREKESVRVVFEDDHAYVTLPILAKEREVMSGMFLPWLVLGAAVLLASGLVFGLSCKTFPSLSSVRREWLDKGYRAAIVLVFAWYFFQVLFFAFRIADGISPDETFHRGFVQAFHESPGFSVEDGPETHYLGSIATRPYLYHLLMGKALHLNFFLKDRILFLRLLNLVLAIGAFWFSYLILREVCQSRWVLFTALFFQANVLMFVFLSAMLSYDNLINFLAFGSTFFLLRFIKTKARFHFLLMVLFGLMGTLTKISYGPLAAIQGVVALASLGTGLVGRLGHYLRAPPGIGELALLLSVLCFGILNGQLYLGNYLKYGQLEPSCDKVLPTEACMQNALFRRNVVLLDTLDERPVARLQPYAKRWLGKMVKSTFGIFGHKTMFKSRQRAFVYPVLILFASLMFLAHWRKVFADPGAVALYVLAGTYVLVIAVVGWLAHLQLHLEVRTQGRYLFPVLVPMVFAAIYPFFQWGNGWVRLLIGTVIVTLSFFGGFPFFLENVGSDWYRP